MGDYLIDPTWRNLENHARRKKSKICLQDKFKNIFWSSCSNCFPSLELSSFHRLIINLWGMILISLDINLNGKEFQNLDIQESKILYLRLPQSTHSMHKGIQTKSHGYSFRSNYITSFQQTTIYSICLKLYIS